MKKYKNVVLIVALLLSAGAVRASIVGSYTNNVDDQAFVGDITTGDLINRGSSTLQVADLAADYSQNEFGLHDGLGGDTSRDIHFNSGNLPSINTFYLNLTSSTFGYDITEINTYAGYGAGSATYGDQKYDILVSTVGSEDFSLLISVDYTPLTGGTSLSTKVSLDITGPTATGVDAIRFVFADAGGFDGTVYQEVDVFGVEAIPEPATLGMLAVMTGGMLFIRSRFVL